MMDASVALMLALFMGKTSAIWDNGQEDSSFSNLGLHTMHMTCNDGGSVCQTCFTSRSHGEPHLHTIEYTTDPYKLQYTTQLGEIDDSFAMVQEEPGDPYHACSGKVLILGDMFQWKLLICMTNDLRGVNVPGNCTRPVALVTLRAERPPNRLRGHQLLLCVP